MKLQITNQRIEVLDASLVVSGSVRQYECECVFSEDWNEYGKTAVFKPLSGNACVASIVDGKCVIPYAAISNDGYLLIGVYGTVGTGDSYKRRPTVWTDAIRVEEGCNDGAVVPDPAPDVYDQIMAAIGEVDAKLDAILPAVTAQADRAEDEADSAAGSASSAAESKASVDATVTAFSTLANEKSAEITTKTSQGLIALENKKTTLSGQLEALETDLAGSLTTHGTEISTYLDGKKAELEADLETKEASLENDLETKADTEVARLSGYVEQAQSAATSAAESVNGFDARVTTAKGEINTLTETKKGEITTRGDEVIASIPSDYSALVTEVNAQKEKIESYGLSVVDGKLCLTYTE